jgi:DtxR family transcriptional regulator, Mn-dependent transcriptional regulator
MTTETTSIQDYLKTIYDLTQGDAPASTTALAARLGIAPASVTGMMKKLAAANPPLVHYRKHQGVTLTETGEQAALRVIRRHRLLETYLVTTLGYSWDTVHEEACRLEHVISEEFESKIAALLGNPKRDPHGDPIPGRQPASAQGHQHPAQRIARGTKGNHPYGSIHRPGLPASHRRDWSAARGRLAGQAIFPV